MKTISVLTDPAKGGTFLAWTLHFLAGHQQYFHAKSNSTVDLTDNPLTNTNAHNFIPNQVTRLKNLHIVDRVTEHKSKNFQTLYFHNISLLASNNGLDNKVIADKLVSVGDKIIILTNQAKNLLYEKSVRSRVLIHSYKNPEHKNETDQEQFDDFIDYFFQDSLQQWKQLNLNDIWDRREFLALNYCHDAHSINAYVDLSINHFSMDCVEWFTQGDSLVHDLFDYLDVKIDQNRLQQWNATYQSWRKIHHQRLSFLYNFDKIIDYIITGRYLDLTRFDLDIYQEAIIQHELIYKHQLNLKTWQLEKFLDTLQLHKLLESNIHKINKIQHSV
jgi:hypothetical protein